MMKKIIQFSFFLAISSFFISPLYAQNNSARNKEKDQITNEERLQIIQTTLELSDEAFTPIAEIFKSHWKKRDQMRNEIRSSEKQLRQKRRQLREEQRSIMDELQEELSSYLSEEQLKSLQELRRKHRKRMNSKSRN